MLFLYLLTFVGRDVVRYVLIFFFELFLALWLRKRILSFGLKKKVRSQFKKKRECLEVDFGFMLMYVSWIQFRSGSLFSSLFSFLVSFLGIVLLL